MKTVTLYRRIELILSAIILSIGLSLVFNSTVSAQRRGGNRGPGPASVEFRLNRAMAYWTQQLNLTSQQQPQFRAVLQQHFTKQDSIRNNFRGNRQAMHGQMIAVRNATHAQLAQILTTGQQKNFTPLWGQRGAMMNGRNWNN